MIPTSQYRNALAASDCLHDQAAIRAAITATAAQIDQAFAGIEQPLFITIMNGGLFFASELGFASVTAFQFDYAHASRYRGTQGGGLEWRRRPDAEMAGRHVLLVDDILDEGHTLLAIREHCLEQGAAAVRIAVLTEKIHDRRAPGIQADHVCLQVPDRYVFGYGMDWHGHGRNLPAIHAVKDPAA